MITEFEYSPELFELASKEDRNAEKIRRPSIKYWPDVWRRLKLNKLAMVGLSLIVFFGIMAFVGTQINGYTYFVDVKNKIVYENREKTNGVPYSFLTKNELEQIERQLRFANYFESVS